MPSRPLELLDQNISEKDGRRPRKKNDKRSTRNELIKPCVVCGPSGVGKGTLLKILKNKYPEAFQVAVSHTTRAPREGEEDGIHYNFVTQEQFQKLIDQEGFLEYANVHGNFYGTSLMAVEKVASDGCICLLEIDIQGAEKVQEKAECNSVFITCPGGHETLTGRLLSRGSESPETIQKRLATAETEFIFLNENPDFFGKTVVNDVLETAALELEDSLRLWYPEKLGQALEN